MIDLGRYPFLNNSYNRKTLKETSEDDSEDGNIQYMTYSELEVIDFDLVKREYANKLGLSENVVASIDAVISIKNTILFIEFKNGKVNNRNIKDKLRDSLLIFLEIINKNISFSRKNIEFILVYNDEKNHSKDYIANILISKGGDEFIRFDLERYKKIYYRDIHTYSVKQFEEYMQKRHLEDKLGY